MSPLATALAAGCTYEQAGTVLGLSRDAARMRAVRSGLRSTVRQRQPNPETAGRIATARRMRAEGHDAVAIGERLGMSGPAVRMMLRRAGEAG